MHVDERAHNVPAPTTLELEEIKALLPHRYPMLLLDRMEKAIPGESGIGIKMVTVNEWFFVGHFPQKPIMPGVLIIEAMAQAAAVLVLKGLEIQGLSTNLIAYFTSVERARFRKPVLPGSILELDVSKEQSRGNALWKFKGVARVDNCIMAEATYSAMLS